VVDGRRLGRRCGRRQYRPALATLLAIATSAGSLSGCHPSGRPDPAVLFQSIYSDYLHGNLDAAKARAVKARAEFSTAGPAGDPAWELRFRLLEAEVLLRQNHPRDTLVLLTGGVAFPPAGDLAIKRDVLCGLAHSRVAQPQQSDQELREARRLAESSHSALIGEVLRAEALVQRDSGNADKAIVAFRESLAVAREHGSALLEAADLVDIGYGSLQSGHYDQALVQSQEAAKFSRSVQAQRQLQLALGNIGWADVNLGDFENALSNFQQAEQLAKEIGLSSRVFWLEDAGYADYKLGDWQAARKYDEEALQAALQLPAADWIDDIVNIETNLAFLLYGQRQYEAAKIYSDQAVRAARGSKDDKVVAYAGFMDGLIAAHLAVGEDAERRLMQAWQLTPDPETRMEIEDALAKLYSDRHDSRQAELWYRRSIETFERNRSSVRDEALRLSSFANGDSAYRDYAEFLIDLHRPSEALQLLDRSRARTLEEGLGVAHVDSDAHGKGASDPQAVARKLGAPILFYSLGPEKSYLWVISAHETRLYTLPKEPQIRAWVEEYQRVIQKSIDPLQTASPAAASLYDALIKPAAAMIPAGSKIFIVPDGILYALNFETLVEPTAAGFQYWIEDVTVTSTSSIQILSRVAAMPADAASRDLLLVGDPVSAGTEFEALPHASAEIERIRKHFPAGGETVLTQARAAPAAYVGGSPDQYRYIHFVAHGTASSLSPLDSAVVLSPAPADPEDFKLYAREIVKHPLHARLVTISACYGSGVRTYAGEGLVGLAWAFLRAGSHNVIGALWQADDAATPLLMDRLYAQLEAGQTPDAALRTAKLALLHSASVYRKPLYWGVFQLYAGA
jgi:CHAT domain-containing protein